MESNFSNDKSDINKSIHGKEKSNDRLPDNDFKQKRTEKNMVNSHQELEQLLEKWYAYIQTKTEQLLTWRKRRKFIQKEKQARKHPLRDWTEVILSAVLIVLLINQYLFQAYQIPTGSMQQTLEIGDRIFVNKFVYGPELLPGAFKINGFTSPKRGEIVIFESPNYRSKGFVFEILHRVIYMLTFTLVNIDVDERGDVAVHFLVKRVVGAPGDRLRPNYGEMAFLPMGNTTWLNEDEMKKATDISYPVRRLFDVNKYQALEKKYMGDTRKSEELPPMVDVEQASQQLQDTSYLDWDYLKMVCFRTLYEIRPYQRKNGDKWRKYELGWYVPTNSIFPMGDNRDNSKDARFFGAVKLEKVLGEASFRFWPLSRLGGIK